MCAILPDATLLEITIDRIHRIAKLPHLAVSVPRDVLMRVHFFHAKEKLLTAARPKSALPAPFDRIQLFPDLSKYLNPVTKAMNNHKIQCKWR